MKLIAAMNLLSRDSKTSKAALATMFTILCATGLCIYGKLDGAQWVSIMQIIVPSFVAAESARKWSPEAKANIQPR